MIGYALSVLLGAVIMFVLPGLAAWLLSSDWNERRAARARRYRAIHGTRWWTPELRESTQRQRQFIDKYKDEQEARQ